MRPTFNIPIEEIQQELGVESNSGPCNVLLSKA